MTVNGASTHAAACATCPMYNGAQLTRLGINMSDWDYIVALAGNPNTGKSTVFNALTGLRQHTGNWPGKTVVRAEGGFLYGDKRYKLVDLPGTYSLLSTSADEEVARDFILFGQPSVTIVVVDATRLERNLNLALQVLEITDRVLDEKVPWPSARLFWRARIAGVAQRLMTDEAARLTQGRPAVVETRAELPVPGVDFRLTAKPDRLDLLADGRVQVYDYKSGKPPTDKQIAHFDKQLPLEAAMVEQGAFAALGRADVAGISYIQLGGDGRTETRDFGPGFAQETWAGFVELIGLYLRGERGFTARLAMERADHASDYDHLSRHGEWDTTEAATPERFRDG